VNVVNEPLTLEILYHCLDHIAAGAAQNLVDNSLVTGLKLENGGNTNFF